MEEVECLRRGNTAVTKCKSFFHFQSFRFINKNMPPFLHQPFLACD